MDLRPGVLLAIVAGGFVGGLARVGVTALWPTPVGGFPWSIFLVNTSGCFLLAFLLVLLADLLPPSTYVRPLLATGFCGAFTTFSAVTASGDLLLAHGRLLTGITYVLGSFLAGLGSAAVGLIAARAVLRARNPTTDAEVS